RGPIHRQEDTMQWLTRLALGGALMAAVDVGAQGTALGTPKAGSVAAKAAASTKAGAKPAANTVAVYPFGSESDGTQTVQSALAERSRMAFQNGGAWTVLDRSSDPKLQKEIDRVHSPAGFNSEVKIHDDRQLNARYVLWGYLEKGSVEPSSSGGAATYNAHLDLIVRLVDVETDKSYDKLIRVSSVVTDRGRALDQVKQSAADAGARKAAHVLGGMFGNKSAADNGDAGRTASGVVLPPTQDEALRRAYDNAGTEMAKWATAMAGTLGLASNAP
ncbi:MAG TPA: hypothetical protein VGD56_05640, partial [Gemmatirosa sp.]